MFEPDGDINDYDKKYVERIGDQLTWKHLLPRNISMGGGWKDLRVSMLWSMAYGISNQAVDKLARTVPTATENSPAFWSDSGHLKIPMPNTQVPFMLDQTNGYQHSG